MKRKTKRPDTEKCGYHQKKNQLFCFFHVCVVKVSLLGLFHFNQHKSTPSIFQCYYNFQFLIFDLLDFDVHSCLFGQTFRPVAKGCTILKRTSPSSLSDTTCVAGSNRQLLILPGCGTLGCHGRFASHSPSQLLFYAPTTSVPCSHFTCLFVFCKQNV